MKFKNEKIKLQKEKSLRLEAEKRNDELASKLCEYEKQVKKSQEALVCYFKNINHIKNYIFSFLRKKR